MTIEIDGIDLQQQPQQQEISRPVLKTGTSTPPQQLTIQPTPSQSGLQKAGNAIPSTTSATTTNATSSFKFFTNNTRATLVPPASQTVNPTPTSPTSPPATAPSSNTPATTTPPPATAPSSNTPESTSHVPSQPECVPGYHWDNSQRQCVPN